eukprot:CAMPEP_0202379460 /NCGR_PEP_ID=MMETSP1127-20130417/24200_1 /ASSEMBLY_ACC=CAM_ASM_000462 /TAXON_ID=3047 /ORGANISM="Dunaliella tertiolecta, Strain CCMP1320" /LENGTH=64 /DNA_ID=CAMNT_0048977977 /DNA_START=106 /DNA_END=300 /DNA_ORIENTATION=-
MVGAVPDMNFKVCTELGSCSCLTFAVAFCAGLSYANEEMQVQPAELMPKCDLKVFKEVKWLKRA